MTDFANKTALISGASSGIGASFARHLAGRGANLVLVARSADKLDRLAEELRRTFGVRVTVVPADLSKPESARSIHAATEAAAIEVDLLVNNAGFSTHGDFDQIRPDRDVEQVMVNVASVVALTRLYLPAMRRRGSGAIVNVASTVAFFPIAQQAVYGATKAFVLSFTEALWAELQGSGVRVLALCPGATDTAFFDSIGKELAAPKSSPDSVVETGLRALAQGRLVAIPGRQNYIEATILPRLLPRAFVARFVAKVSKQRWGAPSAPTLAP